MPSLLLSFRTTAHLLLTWKHSVKGKTPIKNLIIIITRYYYTKLIIPFAHDTERQDPQGQWIFYLFLFLFSYFFPREGFLLLSNQMMLGVSCWRVSRVRVRVRVREEFTAPPFSKATQKGREYDCCTLGEQIDSKVQVFKIIWE